MMTVSSRAGLIHLHYRQTSGDKMLNCRCYIWYPVVIGIKYYYLITPKAQLIGLIRQTDSFFLNLLRALIICT